MRHSGAGVLLASPALSATGSPNDGLTVSGTGRDNARYLLEQPVVAYQLWQALSAHTMGFPLASQ
jgi:hypothetical protein